MTPASTPATTNDPVLQQRARISPGEAAQKLNLVLDSTSPSTCRESRIQQVVEIAAELTGALGVVFLERDAEKRLVIRPQHYAPAHLSHLRSLLQHVMRLSNVAAAECTPQAGTTEADNNLMVVAVPVLGGPLGNEAVAMAMSVDSPEQARATIGYLVQILTWISAVIGCSRRLPGTVESSGETQQLRQLHAMLLEAARQPDAGTRYRLVADWVKRTTQCDEVLFGWRKGVGRRCRVVGYAGHDQFDPRSGRMQTVEEVFDEMLIDAQHALEGNELGDTRATQSLQQLADSRIAARHVLRDPSDNAAGAMLCLAKAGQAYRPLASDTVTVLAQQLHWMLGAEPNWFVRWIQRGQSAGGWLRQPFFWAAMVATALLMLIPLPLKVKTDCVIQPKQRRFVAVPYEGRLEEALAKPGDVVQAGQLLARMDGRDIQWEISTLTADLRRAEKNRDTALADSETSSAQIAGLEADRLRLQIRELHERMTNLEVRSPVEGVVVSGDPEKLEGARFSMGDTLLEVAPLSEMLVELEILDEDISHVRVGQKVKYRLAASALDVFEGRIETIQPRSELRGNQNVFIGFVALKNADDRLRPGMRGQAKIVSDVHPLGWNLFHKAWNRIATWVVW